MSCGPSVNGLTGVNVPVVGSYVDGTSTPSTINVGVSPGVTGPITIPGVVSSVCVPLGNVP